MTQPVLHLAVLHSKQAAKIIQVFILALGNREIHIQQELDEAWLADKKTTPVSKLQGYLISLLEVRKEGRGGEGKQRNERKHLSLLGVRPISETAASASRTILY